MRAKFLCHHGIKSQHHQGEIALAKHVKDKMYIGFESIRVHYFPLLYIKLAKV